MGRRQCVSWEQVRSLGRLLGQVAAQPSRIDQREVLLSGALSLIGAKAAVMCTATLQRPGRIRLSVTAARGWLDERERAIFADDARYHYYRTNPLLVRLADEADQPGVDAVAGTSRQRVESAEWYSNGYIQDVYRPLRIDELLNSFVRERDNTWTSLALVRPWGDRTPFTRAELELAQLLHQSTRFLFLSSPPPMPADLSPRLGQVLELLRQGKSEKEVAAALELSAFTVHRHVGRLYRQLGVGSRAELLARFGQR